MELKISKLKITEDIWSVVVAEKMKKAAKQTAREAIRYLTTAKSAASWEDCFLGHHSLRHYIDALQKGPKPHCC